MGKKFKIITNVVSNEVSLCSKYNSGANKQTEFELVKNKDVTKHSDMKETLKKFIDMCGEVEPSCCAFHDFLNYWLEYDINNTYYNLLSDALQSGISEIQYADMPKEDKEAKFKDLFNMFIEEFKSLPITKTQDGKYIVSLVTKSHNQEDVTNPQSEIVDTKINTKENTDAMEKTENKNIVKEAIDTIATALGLNKSEAPVEEQPVVETEETVVEPTEEKIEAPVEETPAEPEADKAETPVVEEADKAEGQPKEEPTEEKVEEPVVKTEETVVEPTEEKIEAPVEETPAEPKAEEEPAVDVDELMKSKLAVEKELAELKKANEEKEIAIEKMSFVQKAKDEFSMLVGTPEEIGEKLYAISKSNLDDSAKTFVFEQLKKVADSNKDLVQEVGSITKNAGDMTDEEVIYAKAQEISKEKGISINKALRQIK